MTSLEITFTLILIGVILLTILLGWFITRDKKGSKTLTHKFYNGKEEISKRQCRKLLKKQKPLEAAHFGNFKPVKSINKGGRGKS